MNIENFRIALFRFSYVPEETVLLPEYKGGVLRGGFGAALKRVACTRERAACDECLLKSNCAYSQIFETPISKDSKYFEGRGYAPHPFVLEPPLEAKREYRPGDEIAFQLLLVGKAIDFLPYFVLAFHILGQWGLGERSNGEKRGRCFLEKVESINAYGESNIIFVGESQRFSAEYHVITREDICKSGGDINNNEITLEFLTPTRIKADNRLQNSINFEMLIRGLLRRVLALSYFHCGQELELDYKGLAQRAGQNVQKTKEESHWSDWTRYSRRQNTRMMMGGFKGKVAFEGDLGEFMPFLLLGEYIHVGKGTAFGLGKYIIRDEGLLHQRRNEHG